MCKNIKSYESHVKAVGRVTLGLSFYVSIFAKRRNTNKEKEERFSCCIKCYAKLFFKTHKDEKACRNCPPALNISCLEVMAKYRECYVEREIWP